MAGRIFQGVRLWGNDGSSPLIKFDTKKICMKRIIISFILSVCVSGAVFCKNDSIMSDTLRVTGEDVIKEAQEYVGVPYKYGMINPKRGFDCSGLVYYVFKQLNITLPRSSRAQYHEGEKVTDRKALRIGDLVFFTDVRSKSVIGHVGIVAKASAETGEFWFVHAGRQGVCFNSSEDAHYNRRYVGACRVLNE